MNRDMDLVRTILLVVAQEDGGGTEWVNLGIADIENNTLVEHLFLMEEAGLIEGEDVTTQQGRGFKVRRLTWRGHDFLDAVRDDSIWEKTKAGANKAGTAGIEFMWEIAKAYGKEAVKEKLGIDLG